MLTISLLIQNAEIWLSFCFKLGIGGAMISEIPPRQSRAAPHAARVSPIHAFMGLIRSTLSKFPSLFWTLRFYVFYCSILDHIIIFTSCFLKFLTQHFARFNISPPKLQSTHLHTHSFNFYLLFMFIKMYIINLIESFNFFLHISKSSSPKHFFFTF